MFIRKVFVPIVLFLLAVAGVVGVVMAARPEPPEFAGPTGGEYPILFVTQFPIVDDFTTIGSVFGNHKATMQSVGRGGDLWIRYPDGTLKNLTAAAGYGSPDAFQGDEAIAVRDPSVHWDGNKAIFSMVIGAPEQQYQWETYYWQLYEITGLGKNDTPVITKVPHQPANFNNITPIYTTDDKIIFTTDRPRNGAAHLYPQLDEYELAPTVSGLWSLDPATGELKLLNHAPSGDFNPIIDSYGRVVFTQWDHLQRDQQADNDAGPGQDCYGGGTYGTFNYSDETAGAEILDDRTEVFPEPRACRTDLLAGTNLAGHSFNHFFPWQMNQDGTEVETLNHIGRHELHDYIPAAITNDNNIFDYYGQIGRFNENEIYQMLHIQEDPLTPGLYYGITAPEFGTHSAGQVFTLNGAPNVDADHMAVTYITHPDTAYADDTPSANHSGLYRNPLPLSDGTVLVVHTAETREDDNEGSVAFPQSRYDFRLKRLVPAGNGYYEGGEPLTSGIVETIEFWNPDVYVTYSGELWELQPVEVRPRVRPAGSNHMLPGPEQQMFDQAGVSVADLQIFLRQNKLALVVSRDVTTRDDFDYQQPYNLRVVGGTQTIGASGTVYDITHMQFFQADQLRGWTGCCGNNPRPGRRVLAQYMHEPAAILNNPPSPGGPAGSVALAADGSMAAFVPAQRAMTWQLTNSDGDGVVRERYWLTFQPGEIRVCTSCHGLNEDDQAGDPAPTNPPLALLQLLQHWQGTAEQTEKQYLPVVPGD